MKKLNILIVEDSMITIKKMKKMIEDMGHTVVGYANCGEEAIEAFVNLKPDVTTMDITLPGMDGVTCLKEIIKINSKAVVIMVTSHGQEQSVIESVEAGAKGYILKPINSNMLKDQIIDSYIRYGEDNGRN